MQSYKKTKEKVFFDPLFRQVTFLSSLIVIILAISLFSILFFESFGAIKELGVFYIFKGLWAPNKELFGAQAAIVGTLLSSLIALLIAFPIGLGSAIILSEVLRGKVKHIIGFLIEFLSSIPSIIFGMWGIFYLVPFCSNIFGQNTVGLFSASIVLCVMILPFISAVSRDCMNSVPAHLKESAYALGATRWDVIKDIIIPYCKNGILGSGILALGRALGETMAVIFVIGNVHSVPISIFDPTINIPSLLANEFPEADGLMLKSLFYLSFILFGISFCTVAISHLAFISKSK